jgi:tight adherence protein C
MSLLQIALIVGVLNFLAIMLGFYAFTQKRIDLARRLKSWGVPQPAESSGVSQAVKRLEEVMRPIGEMIVRSPEEMSRQEKKLGQAGFRRKDAVALFYAAQVATAVLLALVFLGSGYLSSYTLLTLLLCFLGGAGIPDLWLKSRTAARMRNIQDGLPDTMDLTLVSMEAGLGLDQALLRVGEEIRLSYPELSEELHLRNLEVNMGRSRPQALRNLAERTGVEDLKSLVAILIQTDRFGTSVGDALRVFSDTMRTKRRQRAEEQAAKLSVKMIVPMVLFIFPSMFIVLLGPAVIQIITLLLPALTNGGR